MTRDVRRSLEKIRETGVLDVDFPLRTRLTHAEAKTPLRGVREAANLSAIQNAKSRVGPGVVAALVDDISLLARGPEDEVLPVLQRLLRFPHRLVEGAAAAALDAIGTVASVNVLISEFDDFRHPRTQRAVRAALSLGAPQGFDILREYTVASETPLGEAVLSEVFRFFEPTSFRGPHQIPVWRYGSERTQFASDPRWLGLCIKHRRHSRLGYAARSILEHTADRERALKALDAAVAQVAPGPGRTVPLGDLLSRYQAGEHEGVWTEIRETGGVDGEFRQEVLEVARATMRRVATNVEIVGRRLTDRGWETMWGPFREEFGDRDRAGIASVAQASAEPIPAALLAFYEVVGSVNFVWNYEADTLAPTLVEGLHLDGLDPLSVEPIGRISFSAGEWNCWKEEAIHPELMPPFELIIAPDVFHKTSTSGGAPYSVEVPTLAADPLVRHEAHQLTFVNYLRHGFRFGGFCGLDAHARHPGVPEFLDFMTRDLLPF